MCLLTQVKRHYVSPGQPADQGQTTSTSTEGGIVRTPLDLQTLDTPGKTRWGGDCSSIFSSTGCQAATAAVVLPLRRGSISACVRLWVCRCLLAVSCPDPVVCLLFWPRLFPVSYFFPHLMINWVPAFACTHSSCELGFFMSNLWHQLRCATDMCGRTNFPRTFLNFFCIST